MPIVYLGLGSNRSPRRRTLEAAVASLAEVGVEPLRVSPVYETMPVGLHSRRQFLNCVVEARTHLPPRALLRRLLRLEARFGRHRGGRGHKPMPRRLDIDLLLYGRARVAAGELCVPHPRLAERAFVLQPLSDLNPQLRLPGTASCVRQRLHRLPPAHWQPALAGAQPRLTDN